MLLKNGEVDTEPFIPSKVEGNVITLEEGWTDAGRVDVKHQPRGNDLTPFYNAKQSDLIVLVDYYVERTGGVSEITITPDTPIKSRVLLVQAVLPLHQIAPPSSCHSSTYTTGKPSLFLQ